MTPSVPTLRLLSGSWSDSIVSKYATWIETEGDGNSIKRIPSKLNHIVPVGHEICILHCWSCLVSRYQEEFGWQVEPMKSGRTCYHRFVTVAPSNVVPMSPFS